MDVHLGNKMIQSIFSWLSIWFSSQVYFISSLKRTFVSPLCGIALMNLHLKSHLDIQDKKWSLRKSYFILIWWIVKNFNQYDRNVYIFFSFNFPSGNNFQFWPEITPVRAEGFLTIHLLSMVILALNRCARDIYIYAPEKIEERRVRVSDKGTGLQHSMTDMWAPKNTVEQMDV